MLFTRNSKHKLTCQELYRKKVKDFYVDIKPSFGGYGFLSFTIVFFFFKSLFNNVIFYSNCNYIYFGRNRITKYIK